MRQFALACSAAGAFVLYGCAMVPPVGTERGQGTTRVIHGSVEQILAAARTTGYFDEQHWRTIVARDGALYAVVNDPIDRLRRRVSLMTSPTDANGDTKVEAYAFYHGYPVEWRTKDENRMLDTIVAAMEEGSGQADSAEEGAAVPPDDEKLHAKRRKGGGPPIAAKPAARPAAPAEPTYTSDVDRPRKKLANDADAFAVVVGVEKYSNDLPSAQFAERDAQAVRASLVALGYPERNIKLLTGPKASKSNLEAYLEEWLPRNVKPDGKVFFFFSGHGAPDPNSSQAYLMPFDGDPNYLDKTAYPVKKLYASLGKIKAKQIVVALDACFSGAGGRSVLAQGARPLVTKVDMAVGSGSKITLFSAAAPKEITSTLQDQGHGSFTYYFLKGLQGAAADETGTVTAQGLYDYLKPQVQDAASRQNRDQTPLLEGAAGHELAQYQ